GTNGSSRRPQLRNAPRLPKISHLSPRILGTIPQIGTPPSLPPRSSSCRGSACLQIAAGRPPLVGGEGGSRKPSLLSPTKSSVFKPTRRLPQESSERQPPRGGERGSGGLPRGDGGGTQEVEGDGGERGSGGCPSIRSGGESRGLRGRDGGRGTSIRAGDAGGDGAQRRSDRGPEEEDGSAGAGGTTARPPAREQAGPSHAGKPFFGFLFVLLDYSDAGITDEDFAAYKEKIESPGGALATGLHYKEATHIIVKGNIPVGARILWESELKQVSSIDWVESCSKESRLLATEPKGIIENLISPENIMTPTAKKSHVRNCKSTGSKILKCSARNKLGVSRRLNFHPHHRHLSCAAEIKDTESLYDYSLRYK
uniref:BRCT domain-containing protein n=1 Tax=Triticum urartu TaxID=4572 RepID=A0A8R7PXG5_TRIUA